MYFFKTVTLVGKLLIIKIIIIIIIGVEYSIFVCSGRRSPSVRVTSYKRGLIHQSERGREAGGDSPKSNADKRGQSGTSPSPFFFIWHHFDNKKKYIYFFSVVASSSFFF